jgi:hypothetical protein
LMAAAGSVGLSSLSLSLCRRTRYSGELRPMPGLLLLLLLPAGWLPGGLHRGGDHCCFAATRLSKTARQEGKGCPRSIAPYQVGCAAPSLGN